MSLYKLSILFFALKQQQQQQHTALGVFIRGFWLDWIISGWVLAYTIQQGTITKVEKKKINKSDTIPDPTQNWITTNTTSFKNCLAWQFPLPIHPSHTQDAHTSALSLSLFYSCSYFHSLIVFFFSVMLQCILHYLAHGFLADGQPV